MPIFPVSLMISGISFVSSILEEINSSNWTEVLWIERLTELVFTFAYQRDFYRLWQGVRQGQFCPSMTSDAFRTDEMTPLTCSLTLSEVWLHHYISLSTLMRVGDRGVGKGLTDCSSRSSNWDLPFQYPQVLVYVRTKRDNSLENWPSFLISNRLLPKKSQIKSPLRARGLTSTTKSVFLEPLSFPIWQ